MKKLRLVTLLAIVCLSVATSAVSGADVAARSLRASLSGFEEVPPKLTEAHGTFQATIRGNSIAYRLTYSDLSTPAVAAHIHFAQRGVNGGIIAFLCGGGSTPACPSRGGTVSGTIRADDILALPEQGLAAGDFAGAVRAIRSGTTYVNVHSTRFPEGEIRGQIRAEGAEAE